MVIIVLRVLFIVAAILGIAYLAWVQINKELLTSDEKAELQDMLIKIDNDIEMAKTLGKKDRLVKLQKARIKIKKFLKGGNGE